MSGAAPPSSPEPLALPRDLRTVLTTALAKDPKRRYHSAAAFADDLARVLRGEPVSARPVGRLERTFRWLRRNPLVAALLAAVLASLTIGLLVALSLWQQASRNLRDWERLADGRRLALLQQQADDELLPPTPDKLPAIAAWLASARTLLDRQADHEQALAALRTRALPEAAAARARERLADAALQREIGALAGRASFLQARLAAVDQEVPEAKRERFRRTLGNMLDWTANRQHGLKQLADEPTGHDFADLRDQLQHDQLTELVAGLRRLRGGPGPRTTTIADMEKRQATAATLRQRTIDDHEPAWRDAIARVAANPVYRQFVLLPQLGLIPLGPDPDSRLEEFAAPETGEVPERRDGRLQVGPLTATVFVLLPPGEFAMGAQANDPAAPNHDPQATVWEGPVRRLTVEPFFLAKYEMTQGQWVRLCDDNPSTWSQGMKDGDRVVDLDHPVETIGYRDALTMLARLGWWLPVEARWEYACRAGTSTPWPWPEQDLAACANLADRRYRELQPDGVATVDFDDGHGRHAPVGSYRPNAFGLHDMIGNVAEWCYEQDMPYDPKTTTAAAVPHLVGRQTYLVRGGSFLWGLAFSRSAARASLEGSARHVEVGVRPMRTVQRD